MRPTLGIDPGLGETGMVYLNEYGHVKACATVRAEGSGVLTVQRIENLAQAVGRQILEWMAKGGIAPDTLFAIEHPIMRSTNVDTYRLQAATMHAIMRELVVVAWEYENKCGVVEINPKVSKVQATGSGNATKDQMVKASPFEYGRGRRRGMIQALADAWAHARAGQKGLADSTYWRVDDYQEHDLPINKLED